MKTATSVLLTGLILSLPLMAFAVPGPCGTKGKMMAKLDLTDEQQAQVQELRLEHQKEMITLKDEMRNLRNQMKLMITQDKPSTSEIEAIAGQIGTATRNIALAKADHKMKVRNLLTDEQKTKFDMMTLSGGHHKGRRGSGFPTPPTRPGHGEHQGSCHGEHFMPKHAD